MIGKVAAKVAWVGRTASMVFGLALVLGLVFGVATMALGANGGNFILGQGNAATALTRLTGDVQGSAMQIINNNAGSDDSALNLQVQDGEAPMRVTSDTRVNNLNADKVDGLGAEEVGVNGLEIVSTGSEFNSDSPKSVRAECPEGKSVIGSGYSAGGTISGTFGNQTTDISVTDAFPVSTEDREDVVVVAYEEEPTADDWSVTAKAACATQGTP